MKKKAFFSFALLFCFLLTGSAISPRRSSAFLPEKKESGAIDLNNVRAVSLKALQEQLKAHQTEGSFPEALLQLAGLKSIMGYVIDLTNHDLLLFGRTDPDLPPLYLEDFVLALRNAWFKYAPVRGNVQTYSFPGCSIDPNPQTIQKLQSIAQRVVGGSSPELVKKELVNWHRTCKELQSVRVMGLPFDSRFARVTVKADYDMKTLADGSDSLDLPGFKSLVDMKLNEVRRAVVANQPITISLAGMNRFWFYPGANLYEEDQGVILIKQCPVTLLTEETFVKASGGYGSSGRVDPLAQRFAEGFSILYEKVAGERSIYIELENLFRFVALAKIIKFKSADTQAGLDLNYLLEDFPVAKQMVDKQLPGRSAVKNFQHRQELAGGYRVAYLWLPSCGGVSIEIKVTAKNFATSTSGFLAGLRDNILAAQPSSNNLYRDCQDKPDGHLAAVQNSIRLQAINQHSQNASVVTVKNAASGYQVFSPRGLIYEGNNIPELVNAINSRMGDELKATVYLDTQGFDSPDKIAGFAATCRIQQAKTNSKITVKSFAEENETAALQDLYFSPGIRFEKQTSPVETVAEGQYKGWHKITLTFVTKIKGKIRRLVVEVLARTLQLAQDFLRRMTSYFSAQDFETTDNVSEVINRIRQELQKSDDDFIIKIRDEVGNTEIVILFETATVGAG
jgi:hypothetical protein